MNTKIQNYKDTKIQKFKNKKLQKYKKSKSPHIKSGLTRSCWLLSLRFGTTRGLVSRTGGSAVGSMKSLVVVMEMFFGMVVIKMVKLEHLFLKSILLFVNSIANPVGRATLGRQDPSPEKHNQHHHHPHHRHHQHNSQHDHQHQNQPDSGCPHSLYPLTTPLSGLQPAELDDDRHLHHLHHSAPPQHHCDQLVQNGKHFHFRRAPV